MNLSEDEGNVRKFLYYTQSGVVLLKADLVKNIYTLETLAQIVNFVCIKYNWHAPEEKGLESYKRLKQKTETEASSN